MVDQSSKKNNKIKEYQQVEMRLSRLKKNMEALEGNPTWLIQALMRHGEQMPPMDLVASDKAEQVAGCMAQTYLYVDWDRSGKLILSGQSDAWSIQGFIALLKEIWEGVSAETICKTVPLLKSKLSKLFDLLTAQRGVGMESIIQMICTKAKARTN